ncbi:unnamed protein product, partial [Mesorhabditis belari]|uniref:Uncharacterized protein n=1 Tax=Mesorhabditis belari TaxID=2138241 RepID=A0AAF3J536_9BILA
MKSTLVFIALVAVVLGVDTCSNNDVNGLLTCYRTYLSGYGITMKDKLVHYWDEFHQIRTAMLDQQGRAVQPKICNLGNALGQCTGQYSCLSQDTFVTMGANQTEKLQWALDLNLTIYQCGPGYNTLMADFYCIHACAEHQSNTIDQCTTDMNNAINNGTDACVALNQMIQCESAIFAAYCDYNAGVFQCGGDVAFFSVNNPECKNKMLTCPNYQMF